MDTGSVWTDFVTAFCEVEFLCHSGDPNWLGWLLIGWGGLILVSLVLSLLAAILDAGTRY